MKLTRISNSSIIVENVEFVINFYHWDFGQKKFVTQDIVYEDVIFKDENHHHGSGYSIGEYYSPDWEDWVIILKGIAIRYGLKPKDFVDNFSLFGADDIIFKYGKTLTHHMNDERYNNFLIEERNKKIEQILE
tara:strand:- start:6754 stop:7152 length:399 start_codon:yes stop_codon:yes gene_type:complete